MKPITRNILAGLAALLALAGQGALAQPHVAGEVSLDVVGGLIAGSVCLTNRPADANGSFLLNDELNIVRITNGADGSALFHDDFYNGRMVGEGRFYEVDLPPADPLCVEFTGKVPVYADHDALLDWKGRIAADGRTIRAAEQAKWLPTLYDPVAGRELYTQTFALGVECAGCTTIFMAGFDPVAGTTARFETDVARYPVIYAGRYEARNLDGVWILDSAMPAFRADAFRAGFFAIRDFYAGYLNMPYGGTPAFVEFDLVSQNSTLAFVSWPGMFFGTRTLDEIATVLEDPAAAPAEEALSTLALIAHEAAHYYFGSRNAPAGPYAQVFSESGAEFMAWKLVEDRMGADARAALEARARDGVRDAARDMFPLTDPGAGDTLLYPWRYQYVPLLLAALEDRAGAGPMQHFVQALARATPTPETWAEITVIAANAGIETETWQHWVRDCITPPAAESCVLAEEEREGGE